MNVPSSSGKDPHKIPQIYPLAGPLLFGAAFVPMMPDGRSFWGWGQALLGELGWTAIVWLGVSATPFLLGLCMLAAGVAAHRGRHRLARRCEQAICAVVCLMVSHALMVSGLMWWRDVGVASGEFMLVTLVIGISMAIGHGHARASGAPAQAWLDRPSRGFARWGCLLIASASAWARLQMLADVQFYWGIEVLLLGSCLTVWALSTPHPAPPRAPPNEGSKT